MLWFCGAVGLWCCGAVVLWCCGALGLWGCGAVVLWGCGAVGLWGCGAVGQWGCGAVMLRRWHPYPSTHHPESFDVMAMTHVLTGAGGGRAESLIPVPPPLSPP